MMKILLFVLLLTYSLLCAKNMPVILSTFSLNDKNKTIDFYEQVITVTDDFLLVHDDEEYIYILDFKTGKKIGQFTLFVQEERVSIEADKHGNAKIVFTTAMDPLVGETYHIPQEMLHELIYKDGKYHEDKE